MRPSGAARGRGMVAKASARSVNSLRGLGHGPTVAPAVSVPLVIIRHMSMTWGSPKGRPRGPPRTPHGGEPPSPPIHRYAPSNHLTDLVDRFWVPVWSLAEPSTQTTLCSIPCASWWSDTYARFYGVARGRSSVTLEGDGWAVGTMLTPAAGRLVLGRSVATLTDRWIELEAVLPPVHADLVDQVREAMKPDPGDPAAHAAAIELIEHWLGTHLPGRRSGPAGQSVGDLAARAPRRDPGQGHGA